MLIKFLYFTLKCAVMAIYCIAVHAIFVQKFLVYHSCCIQRRYGKGHFCYQVAPLIFHFHCCELCVLSSKSKLHILLGTILSSLSWIAPCGPGAILLSSLSLQFPISPLCMLSFSIFYFFLCFIYFLPFPFLPILPEYLHSDSRPDIVGGD